MRETGVGIHDPLFFIGVVENNVDERYEGRVQVRAFGVHGTNDQVPTESLPWATLIHGSYDPNAPVPPVNSFVFGFFVDGRDAQQPMILGLIPTQLLEPIDPEITGWGAIPERNADLLARGYRPNDIGQPVIAREARGEGIEDTYVLSQEMNRATNIPTASIDPDAEEGLPWAEPAPAYNASYPFNRVIRSGRNIIELDDTPGAERVSIFHETSGSYISIDTRGTTTHKTMGEKYEINERNQHVYVKGFSNVTIAGDCRVLVQGNKIEQIEGDLIQNVRGNYLLSIGGQGNLTSGEDMQIRAPKIRMEANVENLSIKAAKGIRIQGDEGIDIKSDSDIKIQGDFLYAKSGATISIEAKDAINLKANGGNINSESGADISMLSQSMYLTAAGALDLHGGHVKAGGGTKVSINAQIVAIDDIIQLANGQAMSPETGGSAAGSEEADPAEGAEMPEPVARGVTISSQGRGTLGSAGYTSRDPSDGSSGVGAIGGDIFRTVE